MALKQLEIPEGVKVQVSDSTLRVEGPKGVLEKKLEIPKGISIQIEGNKIKVYSDSDRSKDRAMVGTIAAHIRNAIVGVTKGYVYKLKVIYTHFPVTLKLEGDKLLIQNFLGEKKPREAKILKGVKVEISKQDIIVSGIDIDAVGQTAANIEQATRIVGRDRRVFQDGIYIVEKGIAE